MYVVLEQSLDNYDCCNPPLQFSHGKIDTWIKPKLQLLCIKAIMNHLKKQIDEDSNQQVWRAHTFISDLLIFYNFVSFHFFAFLWKNEHVPTFKSIISFRSNERLIVPLRRRQALAVAHILLDFALIMIPYFGFILIC